MSKNKGGEQGVFAESFWKEVEKKPSKNKTTGISREQSIFMVEGLLKTAQNWSEEVRHARVLIKKHGWEFWKTFKPSFLVNTLKFYFTKDGEKIIQLRKLENKRKFLLTDKKEKLIDPKSPKLGEDKKIEKKPKSIKDFLT